MNNKKFKTEFYMQDLPKQTDIVMNIYHELLKAGGKDFSRDEILQMSVEELLYICTRNNLDLSIEYKGNKK